MTELDNNNKKTELAFKWLLAQLMFVIFGFFYASMAEGWNSIAIFFIFLFFSVVLGIITIFLGIIAVKSREEKVDKAKITIFVAAISPLIFLASIGGLGE